MSGCAGSKHGIINDDLPLKKNKNGENSILSSNDATQAELKNLRSLINARLKRNSPTHAKP